jgi:hypothetical protein
MVGPLPCLISGEHKQPVAQASDYDERFAYLFGDADTMEDLDDGPANTGITTGDRSEGIPI